MAIKRYLKKSGRRRDIKGGDGPQETPKEDSGIFGSFTSIFNKPAVEDGTVKDTDDVVVPDIDAAVVPSTDAVVVPDIDAAVVPAVVPATDAATTTKPDERITKKKRRRVRRSTKKVINKCKTAKGNCKKWFKFNKNRLCTNTVP